MTNARNVTDGQQDWLAGRFEANRTHLRAVAYRMLGSQSEADDAVQDTWLRLSRSDISDVENLSGWLTTVVARVCLDRLTCAHVAARGAPGRAVWAPGGQPHVVFGFTIAAGKIVAIDLLADPERLRQLEVVVLAD